MQLPRPQDFIPVLVSSSCCSTLMSVFVGFFGALCYGGDIKNVFYLNFPKDGMDVKIAEVVLCIVLLITFALQLYPVNGFIQRVLVDGMRPPMSKDDPTAGQAVTSSTLLP